MAEAVCGFQQVSEKPAAKPGAENRSLPAKQAFADLDDETVRSSRQNSTHSGE